MSPQAKAEGEHPRAAKIKDALAEARERGFIGERPGGPAHEEYALPSGPDSPSAGESLLASAEANVEAMRTSLTEGEG